MYGWRRKKSIVHVGSTNCHLGARAANSIKDHSFRPERMEITRSSGSRTPPFHADSYCFTNGIPPCRCTFSKSQPNTTGARVRLKELNCGFRLRCGRKVPRRVELPRSNRSPASISAIRPIRPSSFRLFAAGLTDARGHQCTTVHKVQGLSPLPIVVAAERNNIPTPIKTHFFLDVSSHFRR